MSGPCDVNLTKSRNIAIPGVPGQVIVIGPDGNPTAGPVPPAPVSINITADYPIGITPDPITTGTGNFFHEDSGVTPATYGGSSRVVQFDVDEFGHITTATNSAFAESAVLFGNASGGIDTDASNFNYYSSLQYLVLNETSSGSEAILRVQEHTQTYGAELYALGGGSPLSHVRVTAHFGTVLQVAQLRAGDVITGGGAELTLQSEDAGFIIRASGDDDTIHISTASGTSTNGTKGISFDFNPRLQYDIQVPSTGFTWTVPDNVRYQIFRPVGTLATGTAKFPASPFGGQVIRFSATQTITAFTLDGNGNTVSTAVTTLAPGPLGAVSYLFAAGDSTWYPV